MINGRSAAVTFVALMLSAASVKAETLFDSYWDLSQAVGDELEYEDWWSFPADTLLGGQEINGITYEPEGLVVGSPHGPGWLLGFPAGDGRYRSFSSQTVAFTFASGIDAFGIALSQGNQNQGVRGEGYSLWAITIDGGTEYVARADFDQNDFSGETYLGIQGLGDAHRVEVTRVYSDSSIVWNIRSIAFAAKPSIAALFDALIESTIGVGPGKSLADKAVIAKTYYEVPDVLAACSTLADLTRQLEAVGGKRVLDASIAEELIQNTERILMELACYQ